MGVESAIVLAGGKSTRMGRDKALERIGGVSMLERAVRAVGEICAHVMVVGRERSPEGWPAGLPARFVDDGSGANGGERSGGPLVGVIRGLQLLQKPALVLACDLPLISAETLQALMKVHSEDSLATLACLNGEPQPTVAVYTPAILPELERMLAENRRSLQQVTKLPAVGVWQVPPELSGEFLNVNDEPSLGEARWRLGGA